MFILLAVEREENSKQTDKRETFNEKALPKFDGHLVFVFHSSSTHFESVLFLRITVSTDYFPKNGKNYNFKKN